jgi:hypothetical protein
MGLTLALAAVPAAPASAHSGSGGTIAGHKVG